MALQHFYSRVPAKVSMFNKADGFDTFACSDTLTEEQIISDISCVYNNKPGKDEVPLIRDEKIPPVYLHYGNKNGDWLQSCISFLKHDYTGEHTSFLAHTLIMDDEEKKEILCNPNNAVLNPDLFIHNLDGFDISSFSSHPDDEYPTLKYTPKKAASTTTLIETYDRDMLKRLIYLCISIACGKGKSVYISLCDDLNKCSSVTLEFLNTFLQIFPYILRVKLPFVTYTSDVTKYNDFKIKGILESFRDIPTSKGAVLHFNQKISLGLQDEAVNAERFLVDFFYELLCNDTLRLEFLGYVDSVCEKMPELSKMTTKNLNELVLIFCQGSGLYNEKSILPDEKSVHEFLMMFDKYRYALSDEFRRNSLKCLRRFPLAHAAIPPKTFTKVAKMYNDEPESSKRIIMEVMLDLIHTDAMRSKLFTFLRTSYADENDETKAKITDSLCRVYYGGFLRPQILEFFDEVFSESSKENRSEIFEKVLLTVRTEGIRTAIFGFIEKYYDTLSADEKKKLFVTYCEVACDGGDLSADFSELVNKLVSGDKKVQPSFNESFLKLIEKEQKRKEHNLLKATLSGKYDYLFGLLCNKVFTDWQSRQISQEFLSLIWQGSLMSGLKMTSAVLKTPNVSDEVVKVLTNQAETQFATRKTNLTLADYVNMEAFVNEAFEGNEIGKSIIENAIYPAAVKNLDTVFAIENGMDVLKAFTSAHKEVKKTEEFKTVALFKDMQTALNKKDYAAYFTACYKVADDKLLIAMTNFLNADGGTPEIVTAVTVTGIILKTDINYSNLVADLQKFFVNGNSDGGFESNCNAIKNVTVALNSLIEVTPEEEKSHVITGVRPFARTVESFKIKYKKNAEKWLKDILKNEFSNVDKSLKNALSSETKSSSGGSWISKIFKK